MNKEGGTTDTPFIHNIALGGHAGQNKINPNPDTFMIIRPMYFQAMAYSMDKEIFEAIDNKFIGIRKRNQEHQHLVCIVLTREGCQHKK